MKWMDSYIENGQYMKCHLCGKEFIRCQNSFRSHMRSHIRKGEIKISEELSARIKIFGLADNR